MHSLDWIVTEIRNLVDFHDRFLNSLAYQNNLPDPSLRRSAAGTPNHAIRDAIRQDDAYSLLRPHLLAFEAAEARIVYLLVGSPASADALIAADDAASKVAQEARERVYYAALSAGLDAANREAFEATAKAGKEE